MKRNNKFQGEGDFFFYIFLGEVPLRCLVFQNAWAQLLIKIVAFKNDCVSTLWW